jgi:hypothetical protein
MVLQLKLSLMDTEPVIWRRILVDDLSTLHQLHRMIQILMGWWDYHLYEFDVEGQRFHGPGDEPFLDEDIGEEASGTTLRQLGLRKGDVFDYVYDFGDSWQVEIVVERRRQTRGRQWNLPWLLEGERAGPPEDCGGPPGLAEILEVLENPPPPLVADGADDLFEFDDLEDSDLPDSYRERRELLEWLGDYDPSRFDRRTVNHFLLMAGAWGTLEP